MVVILYANDLPAPPYEPGFDLPGPSFPRWQETWWMPRVVTLFGRFVRDEPIYAPLAPCADPLLRSRAGSRQPLVPIPPGSTSGSSPISIRR